ASKLKYPEYEGRYIPTVYEKLVHDCRDNVRVLFDDGLIVARTIKRDRDVYVIKVEVGGLLKSNKGINLPDVEVTAPSFTEKDHQDLLFGLGEGIDYVALSFIRRKEDVLQVKYLLHKLKKNVPIVAKIEMPLAVKNIEEIISVSDMIMVARGDMGVELGNHLVPAVQKRIITLCNLKGVPVITATQMLESMISNSTPTRAEASDVANAIWDGTDAVMLSGETASGKFTNEAVSMMDKIVREAEKAPKERPFLRNMDLSTVNKSVMVAASLIAEKTNAKAILAITQSGHSCLNMTRFRPLSEVLGITTDVGAVRRMALYWGVTPFLLDGFDEHDKGMEDKVIDMIRQKYQLKNGDKLVITRGEGRFFAKGTANTVRVEIIKDVPKVIGGGDTLESAEFSKGQINLDTHACASCQACVGTCPHEIFGVTKDEEHRIYINKVTVERCALDMACVENCPTGAIEIIPRF
ncbi:MAG: pyruvate kinase, partial [Bdellovibrionota bacterium]